MSSLLASSVLLIRPAAFGFNADTATSNFFQQSHASNNIQERALQEFDDLMETLKQHQINVHVLNDTLHPPKPDAVFPNNWFSTHAGEKMVLYAMEAPSRRAEITREHISALQAMGYEFILDLREEVSRKHFLEGTGSLVFDHAQKTVVAVHSSRTHPQLAVQVATHLDYRLLMLHAADTNAQPVYHTNVVMSIAPSLAIVCYDAINDAKGRKQLQILLEKPGRKVIDVSKAQMHAFCCNALVVNNEQNKKCIVLSETAWHAFTSQQRSSITSEAIPVVVSIPTIEKVGGGSARCMLAELF